MYELRQAFTTKKIDSIKDYDNKINDKSKAVTLKGGAKLLGLNYID